MYILAIETTGEFASVALMEDDRLLSHAKGNDRFSHLQNLMPQVKDVTAEGGITLGQVDAIAVSRGPGSFTGIRIGVSSARALAQVLDIPCIPVSSLEALALNGKGEADDEALICPMLDARRGQIYGGGYFIVDGYPKEEVEAGPYMLDEFLDKVKSYDNIFLLGDAVDKYGDQISRSRPAGVETAKIGMRYQDAVTVAEMGAKGYGENKGVTYLDLKPDYMRMAEAERNLLKKKKG